MTQKPKGIREQIHDLVVTLDPESLDYVFGEMKVAIERFDHGKRKFLAKKHEAATTTI